MTLKETAIKLLVMGKYFTLLIVFDIAAHHDQCLSHKEKKKTSKECKHQDCNATDGNNSSYTTDAANCIDEMLYKKIIRGYSGPWLVSWQFLLDKIEDETSDLW